MTAEQKEYIAESEIRKTISILKPDNQLFEVRAFDESKKVLSGYFRDADTLLHALKKVDKRQNFYITLNSVDEDLDARKQHNRFLAGAVSTSDKDVTGYDWFFIDIDPKRKTGISSTQEELEASQVVARKIYHYLKELGFSEPVKAISGNGSHLLYRIYLDASAEVQSLLARCLEALNEMFGTDMIKIDTVNSNPSRICKLYGTLAQKGSDIPDRPHRMSKIFSAPDPVEITDIAFLKKLAAEAPKQTAAPAPATYKHDSFDLETFMGEHGLTYSKTQEATDSIVYYLDECPFDSSHTKGDARIFQYSNGAIAFKCHHDSCKQYRWQDVRNKFEPGCYDRPVMTEYDERIDEGWRQHNRNKAPDELIYTRAKTEAELQMFRTARQIYEDPDPELEYVPTGIHEIDKLMHGLAKTEITVVTGVRGSGKSTLIGQMILNCVEHGHTVICYSGELKDKKYLNWLIRQAAGHNNVNSSTKYANGYFVKDDKKQKIVDWFGDYYWHYNNKCGNRFTEIAKTLRGVIMQHKADICIIDNLMILDLMGLPGSNKYEQQSSFVRELKQMAEDTNCHILFVAHPRKSYGFMRLEDISGTGDIANIVDNAFVIHRVNHDFKKQTHEEFGWKEDDVLYKADNVIEIAKDRENGTQDEFISLYYDPASKRLKNSQDENVIYSWERMESDAAAWRNGFFEVDDDEIPFDV